MNIRYSYTANTSNTKPEWLLRGYTTAGVFSILLSGGSFRIGNSVSRIGYSHSAVQHITQNLMVHRYGFMGLGFGKAPYFKDYSQFQKGIYEYNGYYNPYSLYGR